MDSLPSRNWIWEQPQWPHFHWDGRQLGPGLTAADQARQHLLAKLETLEPFLQQEAVAALLNREGVNTTAIEGETLDPSMVRSSVARRLQLPLQPGQPRPSAQVEGLVDLLMAATAQLSAPLTVERLNRWHQQLFHGGAPGLRSIPTGVLRCGTTPMQVVSGAIGRQRVHRAMTAPDCDPSKSLPKATVQQMRHKAHRDVKAVLGQLNRDLPEVAKQVVGTTLGGAAGAVLISLPVLYSGGSVTGLSAAGITSGLSAAALGAGMVAGVGVLAIPVLVGGVIGSRIFTSKSPVLTLERAIQDLETIKARLKPTRYFRREIAEIESYIRKIERQKYD